MRIFVLGLLAAALLLSAEDKKAESGKPKDEFKKAGESGEDYAKAGKAAGKGGKALGQKTADGDLKGGASDFGKGMGEMGKDVGSGSKKVGVSVGKGVRGVFRGKSKDSGSATTESSSTASTEKPKE